MDLRSPNKSWTLIGTKFQTELPAYTLLLAERVEEHVNDVRQSLHLTCWTFQDYLRLEIIVRKRRFTLSTLILSEIKICSFKTADQWYSWIGNIDEFEKIHDFLYLSYRTLKIFEKAINKPVRNDLAPIRISEQFRLEQMDNQFQKYVHQTIANPSAMISYVDYAFPVHWTGLTLKDYILSIQKGKINHMY